MQRWIECSNTGSTCRSIITKYLELRVAENCTLTLEFRLPKPDILSMRSDRLLAPGRQQHLGPSPFCLETVARQGQICSQMHFSPSGQYYDNTLATSQSLFLLPVH